MTGWPTTLLIDPEGKLVGRFFKISDMEKHLPKVSDQDYVDLVLSSTPNWGFEGLINLKESVPQYAQSFGLAVEFDPAVEEIIQTKVHFNSGPGTSLAGFLTSMLEPLDLAFEVKGRSLRIVKRTGPPHRSSRSAYAESRIRAALAQKIDVTFDGELRNLIAKSGEWTNSENIVPDPRSLMQGRIDLTATVSFGGKGKTLGRALEDAVAPLGLKVEIRNEAIYLTAKKLKSP